MSTPDPTVNAEYAALYEPGGDWRQWVLETLQETRADLAEIRRKLREIKGAMPVTNAYRAATQQQAKLLAMLRPVSEAGGGRYEDFLERVMREDGG